jgi:hypothetical protein
MDAPEPAGLLALRRGQPRARQAPAVAVPARREQDAGVRLIAVNDVELYYQPLGSGAPLVLLSGLGLDASQMGMLTGPLAEGFQVIAAGNRGTGRSAKPAWAALEISYSAPLRRGRTELVRGCSTCAEQPAGDRRQGLIRAVSTGRDKDDRYSEPECSRVGEGIVPDEHSL